MSNLYKNSMEQMKFSDEFNKNTIMKMSAVRNSQSKSKIKVLRAVTVAAAVAIIVIGAVLGRHYTTNQNNSVLPLAENTNRPAIVVENPQNTVAPTESIVLLSTKDMIIKKQEYGVVSLCTRPVDEIQTLIKRSVSKDDIKDVSCYEDEEYIYFFSENGKVAGITAKYVTTEQNDEDFHLYEDWVHLSEEEAIAVAKSSLLKYSDNYTEDTADRFTIETWYADAGSVKHYINWRITFTEHTASGIQRNYTRVEIDIMGNMATIFFGLRSDISDDELEKGKYIFEEKAISLALDQLKVEGYKVDLDHYTVTSNMVEVEGSVSWVLKFVEMKNADGGYAKSWKQGYIVVLNANNGEWIRTSKLR